MNTLARKHTRRTLRDRRNQRRSRPIQHKDKLSRDEFDKLRLKLPPELKDKIDEAIEESMGQPWWDDVGDDIRQVLEDAIKDALDEGKSGKALAKEIEEVLGPDGSKSRAERIARTESTSSLNAGQQASREELADMGVVTGKTWSALDDKATRESHVEAGETYGDDNPIEVDENFVIGDGEECLYPGDVDLSAEERINCRCASLAVTIADKNQPEKSFHPRRLKSAKESYTFAGYTVRVINAEEFRNSSLEHEEFSNFGCRDLFPDAIPEHEIWLADELAKDERRFLVTNALALIAAVARGVPIEEAKIIGRDAESMERDKVQHATLGREDVPVTVPDEIYKSLYRKLTVNGAAMTAWLVDGEAIRERWRVAFSQGGNPGCYEWLPKSEIWLEASLHPSELPFVLLHEKTELELMREGNTYDVAHAKASEVEFAARRKAWGDKSLPGIGTGDIDLPDVRQQEDFSCILPGQELQGRIIGASKAWYTGKAVKISTSRGATLTVTPNHPVLTMEGFIYAGNLKKGQCLLNYIGKNKSTFSCNDKQHAPSIVEEVFGALLNVSGPVFPTDKLICGPLDFHGDAKMFNGYVDIVGSYRKLSRKIITNRSQRLSKRSFIWSNLGLSSKSSGSGFDLCFDCSFATECGAVGGRHLINSLVSGHMAPDQSSSIIPTAYRNAMLSESICKNSFADVIIPGYFFNRRTGFIELGKLSEIRNARSYSGPLLGPRKRLVAFLLETSINRTPRKSKLGSNLVNGHSFVKVASGHFFSVCDTSLSESIQAIHFGSASEIDAGIEKDIFSRQSADAVLARKLTHGSSCGIVLDDIIHIDSFHYSGPVYDFESTQGWIIVNDLCISNCGAASALSVCKLYETGPKTEDETIRALLTSETEGTKAYHLLQLFQKLGLQTVSQKRMSVDGLKSWTDNGWPVITPIQAYGSEQEYGLEESGHYVVVVGVDDESVHYQDPAAGRMAMKREQFKKRWHDRDASGVELERYGLAVGPRFTE